MSNNLFEYRSFGNAHVDIIEEGNSTGGKDLYMKGLFIQGDIRNQNQRIYPAKEIARAVNTVRARIANNETVFGENQHPEELTINLDRVSHIITDMWLEGADGYGKLKIVPTPMGNIISVLLKAGAKLGVSSRGSGNVDNSGVVSDFEIVTVDIVAQPSAPDAYPRAIYESLYNMKGGPRVIETARYANTDKVAQRCLQKDVLKFIKELKT